MGPAPGVLFRLNGSGYCGVAADDTLAVKCQLPPWGAGHPASTGRAPICRQRIIFVLKGILTGSRPLFAAWLTLAVWSSADAAGADTQAIAPVASAQATARVVSSNSAVADVSDDVWVLPAQLHPWARFSPGSWREIQITSEGFDDQGRTIGRSVTTQKEILTKVTNETYVITVQTTVDVGGKRIDGPPNTRVARMSTDGGGQVFATTRQSDEVLALSAGEVECQVFEVQYANESRHMRDRIFFSADVFPHVLRRDTYEQTTSAADDIEPEQTHVTLARLVPLEWEGGIISCAWQERVRRHEKGQSQAIVLLSPEVPGGEIRSQSTEFDSSGRRIRWSVQKLLAYGTTHTTRTGPETAALGGPSNWEQK